MTDDNASNPCPYHSYTCFLTKQRGWQRAGYVLLSDMVQSTDKLPTSDNYDYPEQFYNTAWVLDPDCKYKIGQVYPELLTRTDVICISGPSPSGTE
ncbi:hypothetical protein [Aristophania vespae]|uniref:hypothetical protein n=1 Tax=Aristophania vespae TaxID=2697033 RepID=UPI0023512F88|nr:hypothetical protein [Aristophania vespae]UMM63153.1 hypothetical protein DM15PD_01080 [Aristophania vespae]